MHTINVLRIAISLLTLSALLSPALADNGIHQAATEMCPGNAFSDTCQLTHTFAHGDHAIVLVSNVEFRQTSFALISKKDNLWGIVRSGRASDLETMAAYPNDPYAFDGNEIIKESGPSDTLTNLLEQAHTYFESRY